jgi:hypothetical protein
MTIMQNLKIKSKHHDILNNIWEGCGGRCARSQAEFHAQDNYIDDDLIATPSHSNNCEQSAFTATR